jgi:thymidylate synthase (FAD)
MKVIEPSFEIIKPNDLSEGIEQLRFIERMARISHRSEDRQTEGSYQRFIRFVVLEKGDWSVVEHVYSTVILRVDRGITHELVRHRLFSYTQESTRFVNYQKKGEMEFIKPSFPVDIDPTFNVQKFNYAWAGAIKDAEQSYLELLEEGLSPQLARSVLPNALAATIAVTGNLRNWRHFLIMRTTKETHPDFRRVTIPLLAEFQRRIPILFEDIVPEQKQSEALSKPR